MGLMARLGKGKPQEVPQGTFQAVVTFREPSRKVPVWVENTVRSTPTFEHPRVAVKELPRG